MKTMTTRRLKSLAVFGAALAFSAVSQASLLTLDSLSGAVIDFSQFGSQQSVVGNVQVGQLVGEDVTVSAVGGDHRVGPMNHGLGANGSWNRSGALNNASATGRMTFAFNDGPVSAVGGFMNYAPTFSSTMLIEVLDALGNVLEDYDLLTSAPISTPNGLNAGAFRGISRASNDIYGFRVSYGFAVIDDLEFTRNSVPEPATLALVGLALAGLGVSRRRRSA